jgi:pimeloyl-ACP methyl ester carboxylesterase
MSKHILFQGQQVHFSVQGQGRVVVLLHGFMESLAIWKHFTRKLSSELQVIGIDLPGHGRSDNIHSTHSMELMAQVVNEVLKALKVSSCHMVGHSMGGYVALAYAEKYPRKLKGLTLFHSQAAADTPEAQENRNRTVQIIKKDKKGFIKSFIPGLFDVQNIPLFKDEISHLGALASSMSKEAIVAALEGMKIRSDRTYILAQSKVPVQFIIGKNDSRIPMEVIMPQTVLPPHAEVIILDHVGHMGFLEAREETFKALRCFALKVLP